jgi:hypothetical protein
VSHRFVVICIAAAELMVCAIVVIKEWGNFAGVVAFCLNFFGVTFGRKSNFETLTK